MIFTIFPELYSQHSSEFEDILITSHKTLYPFPAIPFSGSSPFPSSGQPLSVSVDFPIPDCHRDENVSYTIFCVWLVSVSIVFSRFIHVIACTNTGTLNFIVLCLTAFLKYCFFFFSVNEGSVATSHPVSPLVLFF